MIALRDTRPLSLDGKLSDLDSYLPMYKSILEYRLLAVKKTYRNHRVLTGIMKKAFFMSIRKGYDISVISGTIAQTRLYEHLGFKPFGPKVGSREALYQPMYIDLDRAIKLKKESRILIFNDGCEFWQIHFLNKITGKLKIIIPMWKSNNRIIPHQHFKPQKLFGAKGVTGMLRNTASANFL